MAGWHLIAPTGLTAQVNEDQVGDVIRDPSRPWQLEADEVNYDQRLDKYNACLLYTSDAADDSSVV